MSDDSNESKNGCAPKQRKPGRLTMLNLGWLAERIRKAERIRGQLQENNYRVNSEKLARALLNEEERK